MTATTLKSTRYRPTESKYKGGAKEMYVTYDLEQRTKAGSATYPKVKRVYIAGQVKKWKVGSIVKRSGREVRGVRIEYEQSRRQYRRKPYTAKRGHASYKVAPAAVAPSSQLFAQIVEVPRQARHVRFYRTQSQLPSKYRHALQDVR